MGEDQFHFIFDGLLRSAAIFAVLIIFLSYLSAQIGLHAPRLQRLGCGFALGLFSAACMVWPIGSESGFLLDVRVVPVVLSAPFFGLPAGLITLAIAAGAWALLAGAGTAPGVAIIVLAGCGGFIAALWRGWSLSSVSEPGKAFSLGMAAFVSAWATASIALPVIAIDFEQLHPTHPFLVATKAVVAVVPVLTFGAALVLVSNEKRRDLETSLRASNERLTGIIANVPGVICRRTFGPDGLLRFDLVGGRVREVLGIEAQDLMQDSNAVIDRILPEDLPRIRAAMAKAAQTRGGFDEEYRYRHPDGSTRWIHAKTQVRENRGDGMGDGIFLDVTRLRMAEAAAIKAKQRADWVADHDVLTGLTDRLALIRRAMQEMQASPEGVALVLLDLSGSKDVNERFGHAIGDARIMIAARRISGMLPPGFVARMAGDTFGLLVTDGRSDEDIARFAERTLAVLGGAAEIDGAVVPLGAHCGYAVMEDRGRSVETLVRSAEIALEVARERDDGSAIRYSPGIEHERTERQRFVEALASAIDIGALTLVWQPIVAVADRVIVGREALCRWNRPGEGPVAPDRFAAAAERSGLWQRLDHYVLRRACKEAARQNDGGWISVNVASNWVGEGDLVAIVAAALAESGLPAHRLWLEFTERVVIDEPDRASALIAGLRELGVQVAIDDFGAVYSSLSYLHRLPIAKIKLDRGFVEDLETDMRARAIVDAVLGLCAQLSIDVVAEGVETEGQLAWLEAHGCRFAQGYLIGRPQPAA